MHDGRPMQYDPILGQGQGHEPFKVGNMVIFKMARWKARGRLPINAN